MQTRTLLSSLASIIVFTPAFLSAQSINNATDLQHCIEADGAHVHPPPFPHSGTGLSERPAAVKGALVLRGVGDH